MEDFFKAFEAMAQCIGEGAALLNQMATREGKAAELGERIRDLEHQADDLTHETIRKLNATFITPFDREDIHALISRLDDVMDSIHVAATRIVLFEIQSPPPDLAALTSCLSQAVEKMKGALAKFRDLKNAEETMKEVIEINRIENQGDAAFRTALGNLFRSGKDAVEIIKLKDVFEAVESAIDCCEDVGDTIESVLVKFA
jgi:predicted phosphate transport protein (TIGR00153 family)